MWVDAMHWWRRRVWRRLPARRSTVVMVVLFFGLGALYLQVRAEPREPPVLPIFENTATTLPAVAAPRTGSPVPGEAATTPPLDTHLVTELDRDDAPSRSARPPRAR